MPKDESAATADTETTETVDDTGAQESGKAGESQSAGEESTQKVDEPKYSQRDLDAIANKIQERMKREQAEALDKERKNAEKKRLEEAGKWKEVAEQERAEKEALLSEKRRNEFRENSRAKLRELGAIDFEEVLLSEHDSPDRVAESAQKLKKIIAELAQREVEARLETGKQSKSTSPAKPKDWTNMSPEEWAAEKKRMGIYSNS